MTETDTPTAVPMDEPTAAVPGSAATINGPEGLDRIMEMNLQLYMIRTHTPEISIIYSK